MEFMVDIDIKKLPRAINYQDNIFLIGSCFTEHIGSSLQNLKFNVLQNPNGILFDPSSVCSSILSYLDQEEVHNEELFHLNDVWHSWAYHSRFSNTEREKAIQEMNHARLEAHQFLKKADWIIITLGSSFSYRLTDKVDALKMGNKKPADPVANCHRAPAAWFDKHLMTVDETISVLDACYHRLLQFNPKLQIIYTVSPVRHLRDGVVENSRSKARLIEAVHHMVNKFDRQYYFPAYELVIDVLRDYRFYDIDLAHPNYMATSYVMERFIDSCIDKQTQELMEEVKKIITARKHRALQPAASAHRDFLLTQAARTSELMKKYPFLDLSKELEYFTSPV